MIMTVKKKRIKIKNSILAMLHVLELYSRLRNDWRCEPSSLLLAGSRDDE